MLRTGASVVALVSPGVSIAALSAAVAFAVVAADAGPGRQLNRSYRSVLLTVGVALGLVLLLGTAATIAGAVPGPVIG